MDMAAKFQDQTVFHMTGKRAGEGLTALTAGFRPALLAPYRDLTRLRYDYPVVLIEGDASRDYVRSLSSVVGGLAGLALCARTDASLTLAEPGIGLNLPLQTRGFQGQALEMTAQEQNVLDEGVRLARTVYRSEKGLRVLATVVVGGPGKRTLHRPEVCLPGQGWTIASSNVVPVSFADGREVEATLLQIFRETELEPGQRVRMRGLNFYWYVGSDGTTRPDYYGHISKGYQDAILRNLNHRWSMVSIFVPVSEAPPGQEDPLLEFGVLEEVRTFLADWVPAIRR
jgi:hypothetical protein